MNRVWRTDAARMVLTALVLGCCGCTFFNREGPDVTCPDLNHGVQNACEDGIIASCLDGEHVTYKVCTEDDVPSGSNGIAPEDICGQSWQKPGAYTCDFRSSLFGGNSPELATDAVEIVQDSNDDDRLSPGETATLMVSATNSGTSTAFGIAWRLQSTSPYVSITACDASCTTTPSTCSCEPGSDYVSPGSSGAPVSFSFNLSEEAPSEPVSFSATLRIEEVGDWTDTFQVQVVSP